MALTNEEIKQLLIANRKAAAAQMDAVLTSECISKDFFIEKLSGYIMFKFMLDPSTTSETGFNELTELSMAQSMKISPELVKQFDLAKSCDGTSSAMAKKVLLLRSIEKALNIEIPAMASARVKTLFELCELIWNTLCLSPQWQPKLKQKP